MTKEPGFSMAPPIVRVEMRQGVCGWDLYQLWNLIRYHEKFVLTVVKSQAAFWLSICE